MRLIEAIAKLHVSAVVSACRTDLGVRAAFLVALALPAVPAVAAEWPVLKTYEGEFLRRIRMPMGGIGTGTISLAGNGGLVDWAIFNTPAIGNTPMANDVASGFLIRTEEADGKVSARLLEGPVDTSLYDGGEGCRVPNHAFPRFRECAFKAANLAQRDRFAEAEKVVRDIRNRYDGRKRNPFDEAECGLHYVRALAAWSVLKAWK